MIIREDYVGSFRCQKDDGQEVVIDIYQDIIDAATRDQPTAEIGGPKSLRTQDGLTVNRLEKGRYEIVQTGEVLTSDDPNAP